jgi:phosphohistidine phosphatase SixA
MIRIVFTLGPQQHLPTPRYLLGVTRFAFLLLLFISSNSWAQTVTATQNGKKITTDISAAPALAIPAAQVPPPAIDPAKELKGIAIVNALQKGGYNLYMRHGAASTGQDASALAQTPRWWENCTLQRNLSAEGREQARTVGLAMQKLKVALDVVKTSQFCRARDTAYAMGMDAIEITEDLNHQIGQRVGFDGNAARFRLLATPPPTGKNVLMISHTHGSPRAEERAMGQMQEAEIVLYRPNGQGGADPVARIALADWDTLLAMTEK